MRLYNTLSREVEELRPLRKGAVGLYTCGPTVYNFAHIGNLRTYIFNDTLERALRYEGYRVKRVMNITDVGHLASDADEGDDKMERNARTKRDVLAVARKYTKAFLADMRSLNMLVPKRIAPATKFVPEQIALVKRLFARGHAYDTPQAVYFDVSTLPDYGKLAGQSLADKLVAARGEVRTDPEKHNPADFALWFKRTGRFANHILHWRSPWGDGFPGWHVECSAIARHFLGQPFDIHTGGVDHIGTHHTNEIAQSEGAYGTPLARLWVHAEHLQVDGAKMAKSLDNFYTLADIGAKGFDPLAFRYLALGAHYRTRLNFTWDALEAAAHALANLRRTVAELQYEHYFKKRSTGGDGTAYAERFRAALADDLATPQALAALWDLLRAPDVARQAKIALTRRFDAALGLDLAKPLKHTVAFRKATGLLKKYATFRSNKQFVQSDALRKTIESLGYGVKDAKNGSFLVPKTEIPISKHQISNKNSNV